MPVVAILLGQALECSAILAYLPLNRALRHLALRCKIDDMSSEQDILGGADTLVAIAGGSPRGHTHEANL
jgi:hypothetical protein